jgi:hypothetical protein
MIGGVVDLDRVLLAMAVAAGLLALLPIVLRRFRSTMPDRGGVAGRPEVVAQQGLDIRHRMLVVRYRQTEHLIILGGSVPVVVGKEVGATDPFELKVR